MKQTFSNRKGIREDDIIYLTPSNLQTRKRPDSVPIIVTSDKLKKGKQDTRELNAWVVENSSRVDFILTMSRNELTRKYFSFQKDSLVEYNGKKYECYQVSIMVGEKIYPVLQTIPAA